MKFATIFGTAILKNICEQWLRSVSIREEKFLEIHQPAAGFPIVGGAWGAGGGAPPPFYDFFEPLPIKTDPPHGAHPPLKNEGGGGGTALSCED